MKNANLFWRGTKEECELMAEHAARPLVLQQSETGEWELWQLIKRRRHGEG